MALPSLPNSYSAGTERTFGRLNSLLFHSNPRLRISGPITLLRVYLRGGQKGEFAFYPDVVVLAA
jgi:hypothetical protein